MSKKEKDEISSSPTRMTSVILTSDQGHLKSPDIVSRIRSYLEQMDVDDLAARKIQKTADAWIQSGAVISYDYVFEFSDAQTEELRNASPGARELRRSVRIPVELYEQMAEIARRLGATQSTIIRHAIAGTEMQLRPSTEMPADDTDGAEARRIRLISHISKTRARPT